jgi:hypothetical protein
MKSESDVQLLNLVRQRGDESVRLEGARTERMCHSRRDRRGPRGATAIGKRI